MPSQVCLTRGKRDQGTRGKDHVKKGERCGRKPMDPWSHQKLGEERRILPPPEPSEGGGGGAHPQPDFRLLASGPVRGEQQMGDTECHRATTERRPERSLDLAPESSLVISESRVVVANVRKRRTLRLQNILPHVNLGK